MREKDRRGNATILLLGQNCWATSKEGVTYAIQCKCYASAVGVKAVQEAYAGRDYYDRMVGAVLTNQYFTQPAVDAARKLKILLWDRDYLEDLADSL